MIIIHKIGYKKGSKHEYDIYKENKPTTPKQAVNIVDLWYLGKEKIFSCYYVGNGDLIISDYKKDQISSFGNRVLILNGSIIF